MSEYYSVPGEIDKSSVDNWFASFLILSFFLTYGQLTGFSMDSSALSDFKHQFVVSQARKLQELNVFSLTWKFNVHVFFELSQTTSIFSDGSALRSRLRFYRITPKKQNI